MLVITGSLFILQNYEITKKLIVCLDYRPNWLIQLIEKDVCKLFSRRNMNYS